MSRDSIMLSQKRSRETLGNLSNNITAIPMPSSSLKRTSSQSGFHHAPHTAQHARTASGTRMSLAPGRPSQPNFQRGSNHAYPELPLQTVQRPGPVNMFASASGRKSFAPVLMTPAQPTQLQDSTQRRSSVYSARPSAGFGPANHQSFFATAPPANGVPADPRKLRDPTRRAQIQQELMDFLTQRNFELDMKHSLTHNTLTSPTQKDFTLVFQFLYHKIDPSYRFVKAIDAEVPPLLKQMRYPYEKNISKSQLAAVGGPNWSAFLGLLHWMMQLHKMTEEFSYGAYDDACLEAGFDIASDRITFNFLSDAYKEWLSIEDDDDEDEEAKRRIQPHIDAMAAKFEEANQLNLEQLKQLEAEGKALQDQIDELSLSAPKLAKLDEQIKVLEEDRIKFENYNTSMDGKVQKYENRVQLLQQEINRCEADLAEAESERAEVQQKVDEQGLSVQDIDRMNNERERLQKGAETAAARLEESKDHTSKKEAEATARMDDLEALVQKYNGVCYQIGLIPSTGQNANGFDHELRLSVNDGPTFRESRSGETQQFLNSDRLLHSMDDGYQPQHVMRHFDLRGSKRALQDLRRIVSERRNGAMEEDMAKMDMLDKTREALEDKHAEMETLGHRLHAAQEEFEKMREITSAQNMASDTQIEKMEKELAKIRAGVTESVQYMEQKEMNTSIEYEQLTVQSAALREGLHTELEKMLNDIIKFKIHIQGSLEAYEDFVAQEVERECAEQEAADAAAAVSRDQEEETTL